jgi:hypothetical protein
MVRVEVSSVTNRHRRRQARWIEKQKEDKMAVNVHAFDHSGRAVSPRPDDEDEGAPPPMPPSATVTLEDSSGSPTPDEIKAQRAVPMIRKSKAAPAIAATDILSIRLQCLTLAAASGETDPAKVMDIAVGYLKFLEGA